jgi:hypothetical protein
MVARAVQAGSEGGGVADGEMVTRCVRERAEERPGSDEVLGWCEGAAAAEGEAKWPQEEKCRETWGVWKREV